MNLIIDIKVKNLKRATDFYSETLGLSIRKIADTWSALTIGDAEIHLFEGGGVTGHVEFYVDDVDSKVEELSQKGIVFTSGSDKPEAISVDHKVITLFPWGRTAFFKDSEGNELAIVRDH